MSDIPIQPTPESTVFSVGQILRAEREARDLSLQYVAEKLKLTPRQLLALEGDDFPALPGNTFVRGFVRNYARLLQIDPQPLLDHLAAVLPTERIQAAMPPVSDATALNATTYLDRQVRAWPVWLMVVLGLLLGAGVVFWYLQKPATPEVAISVASEPAEMAGPHLAASAAAQEQASGVDSSPFIMLPVASPTASAPVASVVMSLPATSAEVRASRVAVASASLPVARSVAASATATSSVLRVAVEFDSWVQIVDADGQVLVSQLLGPGTERTLSGKAPFRVRVGNAPKTQLYYRGQQVDLKPYIRGDVATLELK